MGSGIPGAITRLINSTWYSLNGLRDAWRTQAPFPYECYVLVLVIPIGWLCGENAVERSLLIGSWLVVLMVELINSAIKNIVDRIGIEYHDLSRRAKDLGSAAVFCSLILFAIIWVIIWLR